VRPGAEIPQASESEEEKYGKGVIFYMKEKKIGT